MPMSSNVRAARTAAVLIGAGVFAAPAVAAAHFLLMEPSNHIVQDSRGDPQKLGPCGNDAEGMPTGEVTAFAPGYVFLFFCAMMVLELVWVRTMVPSARARSTSPSVTPRPRRPSAQAAPA